MIQRLLTLLLIAPFCCLPVQAMEDDFENRVRRFILDNPQVILEALTILSEREARAANAARIAQEAHLFEDRPYHGIGDPDAPIRVIEFFDYKCAPCKAMHPRLVDALAAHPRIRVEMRHLPILSPASERAARFALAVRRVAGAADYQRVHQRLWAVTGPINSARLERIADEEGLDYPAIETAMAGDWVSDRIARNRDTAIALEILGTPAFVSQSHVSFGQSDVGALVEIWLE